MLEPKRGEVWMVDLGLSAKVRPCRILNIPIQENDNSLITIITIITHTTSPRSSRFEVEVITNFLRPGVFDTQSIVTVPQSKLIRKLGKLLEKDIVHIENGVRLWLAL